MRQTERVERRRRREMEVLARRYMFSPIVPDAGIERYLSTSRPLPAYLPLLSRHLSPGQPLHQASAHSGPPSRRTVVCLETILPP